MVQTKQRFLLNHDGCFTKIFYSFDKNEMFRGTLLQIE